METKEMKVALMIMAAGESKRFGGCKQLSQVSDDHSLLSHAIEQAVNAQIGPVFVVTGRWHNEIDQVQQQGAFATVPLLHCPDWAQGLGRSIAYGVEILAPDYNAILITLADQVALTSEDFHRFVELASKEHIVCSHYNGKRGVPVLFPACYFPQLTQLNGEHGARSLLRGEQFPIREITLPHAKYDIDTPQALAEFKKIAGHF
ncbi:hypothetical protein TW81_16210 [Vibrio galatheae]|uniref:MobA-like NTP transferase domain-containing protein n=1 Tax=Vibrio galatheae TaxID=579748 RepID=A0A0F4NGA0_9VIBR|nr:nucleotidyltransferase family protein [Vibrio galatheae]KJY81893.1 hypothetical protein TW81_16210 [Vibrio galatheae]